MRKNRFSRFLAGVLCAVMLVCGSGFNYPVYADSKAERKGDRYDKTNTITGIIYNELRAMELDWAEEIRTYGTKKMDRDGDGKPGKENDTEEELENNHKLDINVLYYTEKQLDAREYASSRAGLQDLLGPWVLVTVKVEEAAEEGILGGLINEAKKLGNKALVKIFGTSDTALIEAMIADGRFPADAFAYEGIQGPEPFYEAEDEDYKILQNIDVGNELEVRGKPQEGYTSNAKQITSMASVFYQQMVDELVEEMNSEKALTAAFATVKYAWKMAWTQMEERQIPFLADIARSTGWSWSSTYRTYAFPLLEASHQTNFFLNSYIYPTKWTMPIEGSYESKSKDSHWDGHINAGEDVTGNQEIKVQQGTEELIEAKNGRLGTPKESGSGKVTTKFLVSRGSGHTETESGDDSAVAGTTDRNSPGGTWNGQGSDEWEFIERCPYKNLSDEGHNDGYGCMTRLKFFYKWPARNGEDRYHNSEVYEEVEGWTTTEADEPIEFYKAYNETVYYKNEPDLVEEADPFTNYPDDVDPYSVAQDVSPWKTDANAERGFHPANCLVNFFRLNDEYAGASSYCWYLPEEDKQYLEEHLYMEIPKINIPEEEMINEPYNGIFAEDYHDFPWWPDYEPEHHEVFPFDWERDTPFWRIEKDRLVSERLKKALKLKGNRVNGNLRNYKYIQYIEITEKGIDVWVSRDKDLFHYERFRYQDENGDWQEQYSEHWNCWHVEGIHFKLTHMCLGHHEGTYCGGHLQLRTRAVVYGYTKAQMDEATNLNGTNIATIFKPKFITLFRDGDSEEQKLLMEKERSLYPELEMFNVDEHTTTGEAKIGDSKEERKKVVEAEDIFDIDVLIKRKRNVYPGYKKDDGYIDEEKKNKSTIPPWESWTANNILNAVSLNDVDWNEEYGLTDTQSIVGGIYDAANPEVNNAINDTVKEQIMILLGKQNYNMSADLKDPKAKNVEGNILSAEDRNTIYRLRHVQYALDTVGKVGYAQSRHAGMYENIAGHATDCSGYVSNIWRDVFDTSLTTVGLRAAAESANALHEFYGTGTSDIKPGDIILKEPEGEGAHALIYIGKLNRDILHTIDKETGDAEYAAEGDAMFTVDCSSMVMNANYLPEDQTPEASKINTIGSLFEKAKTTIFAFFNKDTEPHDEVEVSKVRAGNTRFAARKYVQEPKTEMFYIDMEKMWTTYVTETENNFPNNGRMMIGYNFEKLGLDADEPTEYWKDDSILSDDTIVRGVKEIELHPADMEYMTPKLKIDLEEEEEKEEEGEEYDFNDRVVDLGDIDAKGVYINQGDYRNVLLNGKAGHSVAAQGCCMTSYIMAAQILNGRKYDAAAVAGNSRYFTGGISFVQYNFLSDMGLAERPHSGYSAAGIKAAVERGNPVELKIQGASAYHAWRPGTTGQHHLILVKGDENGVRVLDPGNRSNTYLRYDQIDKFTAGQGVIAWNEVYKP